MQWAHSLKNGDAPWTQQTGLVVHGYVSGIDGSVPPYRLEIPDTYDFKSAKAQRLDVWFHGRGNTLSELKFINDRGRQP